MKKLIYTIALVITFVRTNAQTDSTYVEIGVNTLRIVSILLDDKPTDFEVWNPYLFTFEAHVKRVNLRFGFGQNKEEISEIPTAANGKVYVLNDTVRTDMRFGLGYDFKMHKRWSMRLGVDFFTLRELQSMRTEYLNENGNVVKTTREVSTKTNGFAPFVYFQFHLTSRVSLGTELLYRISSYKSTDIDSNSLNEFTIEREFEGKKRIVMAPTALFLCARF